MSAQTGLITIGLNDLYDFMEACEESYVYIESEETHNNLIGEPLSYDMRISFQTVAQVFVLGQIFLKKIVEKDRLVLENS